MGTGMDYLKSCLTNVIQPSQDAQRGLKYSIYGLTDEAQAASESDKPDNTSRAQDRKRQFIAKELVAEGILAKAELRQNRIWLFDPLETARESLRRQNLSLFRSGIIEAKAIAELAKQSPPSSNATGHVIKLYLSAVEDLIGKTLSLTCETIILKPFAWIASLVDSEPPTSPGFDSASTQQYRFFVSINVCISPLGTILFLPEVSSTSLMSIAQASIRHDIQHSLDGVGATIAPMGKRVRIVDGPGPSPWRPEGLASAPEPAPVKYSRRLLDKAWMVAVVTTRLNDAYPGLVESSVTLDPKDWLWVSLRCAADSHVVEKCDENELRFLWPASLCFVPTSTHAKPVSHERQSDEALRETLTAYCEPIETAEQWFSGANERAAFDTKANEMEENTNDAGAVSLEGDPSNTTHRQRGQDAAQTSAVYPTPPDGVAPAMSSESGPATAMAIDDPPEGSVPVPDSPDHADRRSSVEMDLDNDVVANGDLFGDADEEMYGGPDVTDADFSFFDESAGNGRDPRDLHGLDAMVEEGQDGVGEASAAADEARSELLLQASKDSPRPGTIQALDEQPLSNLDCDAKQLTENLGGRKGLLAERPGLQAKLPIESPSKMSQTAAKTPPQSPPQVEQKLITLAQPASDPHDIGATMNGRQHRRNSNFEPVDFAANFVSANSKYGASGRFGVMSNHGNDRTISTSGPVSRVGTFSASRSINLPSTKRDMRRRPPLRSASMLAVFDDTSSDEDSSTDTEASIPGSDDAQQLHAVKKQRRGSYESVQPRITKQVPAEDDDAPPLDQDQTRRILAALTTAVFYSLPPVNASTAFLLPSFDFDLGGQTDGTTSAMWPIFDFTGNDYNAIAELVMADAKTSRMNRPSCIEAEECSDHDEPTHGGTSLMQGLFHTAVEGVFGHTKDKSFALLASMGQSMGSLSAEGSKNQPRPLVRRSVSTGGGPSYGPHLLPLSAPFIRVKRASTGWDMLHSALDFWQPLGLEPCSGPKDVMAYAVVPGNSKLGRTVQTYLQDLGQAYEQCKFGTHHLGSLVGYQDGLSGIMCCRDHNGSKSSIIKALRTGCIELADILRERKPERKQTTVIYIVNPFDDQTMTRYICACFLEFCHAYGQDGFQTLPDDVKLQVLPMKSIAISDQLIVPDDAHFTHQARLIYDKCIFPASDKSSALSSIFCAPSFRLVSGPTRKINFALHETPPSNIMQEAQILHMAYAISTDGDWLTAAWTDYTGQYQHSTTVCLTRMDHHSVLAAIRSWTLSHMLRTTTWRLIIAKVGTMTLPERLVWKEAADSHIAITTVDVSTSSPVKVYHKADTAEDAWTTVPGKPGAGFLTPVSTPQPSSQTVSPDAYGTNGPNTPMATDAVTSDMVPPDVDAHLIDLRDETWALCVPFSTTHSPDPYTVKRVQASGILLKRGDSVSKGPLRNLGIDVIDNLPPRVPQGQNNWLMTRSPEGVLREVLAWYRALAVLAKIRGINGAEAGNVPWHIAVAVAGAQGLNGFLGR